MIDMRKPRERRIGEKYGSPSWWAVLDAVVILALTLALTYIGFMLGRWYCEASHDTPVNQASIAGEYKAYHLEGH